MYYGIAPHLVLEYNNNRKVMLPPPALHVFSHASPGGVEGQGWRADTYARQEVRAEWQ